MVRTLFFLLAVGWSASHVTAQEIRSLWMDRPVSIDGKPDEWPSSFRYYDGKTRLQFALANDSAHLYVCLKISDEQAQLQLFHSGVEVWIDPKGKRGETVGIRFPLKHVRNPDEKTPHENQSTANRFQKSDIDRLKLRILSEKSTIGVKGFLNVNESTLEANNPYGIRAALAWDSLNILCIEYQLPVALTLQHAFTAKDTLKPLGLGLVEPSVEPGSREAQWHREEGEESNGGWGGGAGSNSYRDQLGSNGMNPQPGSTDWNTGNPEAARRQFPVNTATEEQKVWNKVRLAWPP